MNSASAPRARNSVANARPASSRRPFFLLFGGFPGLRNARLERHRQTVGELGQVRRKAPEAPGASTEILPEALAEFSYPSGPAWQYSSPAGP